ncbi:NtaA/DmoA family FMN-dependent monooxygenase [Oceanicola sp. S124]|uniref:NtaA/DmoA family FMN-dependent monooxygenase n=1 Tax=Oceanicola sp. S124 TaxID=1042378 RepID=UPI00025585E9|nr:NtaA/DmoA family FMN-dependent monooxygenase [Oceanicola sp. S124]
MKLRDTLCIGMSLAPTWLRDEGWRRPGSGIEGLFSAEFALDIARRSEAAHLDFVFRPDTHSLPVPVMETSFGFASLDSVLMMAALVQGTSRIGLVPTISTTFAHPYPTARQLMSLHWMSQGRAGCNIVTALQGQQNFGLTEMPSSADRYARAGEFVTAMQALWQSFPSEALRIDRATGQFADTALIRPADHHGAAFDIEGPLNIPAFPGPHIPMMQAGASAGGIALAGQMAEMVFAQTLTRQDALAARQALSRAAKTAGRAPRDVRLLPGLSLYLADSRAEARDLFEANHARVDRPARLARLREATGLDLTAWPGDRPVRCADLPAVPPPSRFPTYGALLRELIAQEELTVDRLLARPELLASVHWQIIGTVEDAFQTISHWFETGAIDGFVAVPGGAPRSMHLTLEQLVPRLAEAGLFRKRYTNSTLTGHLAEG